MKSLLLSAILFFYTAYLHIAIAGVPIETVPMESGPYPVASTNIEVSSQYVGIGRDAMKRYLSGHKAEEGHLQYLTDILKHPYSALVSEVQVPNEPDVYGPAGGMSLPVVTYIVYPSGEERRQKNTYAFPYFDGDGNVFEDMVADGEAPRLAGQDERYPLIVISHGFRAHGMHSNYVEMAHGLASHGYIAAIPSFGDIRIFEEGDESFFFVANLRPLLTKAVIDSVLDSEAFGPHIDANKIGMFGRSLGGLSTLALGGAQIRNSATVTDPRIKVGVLSLPWVGGKNDDGEEFHAFGADNAGLASVSMPILSFVGTKDEIAKPSYILPSMRKLSGPTYVVELVDQTHGLEQGSRTDRNNWQLLFLSAYLKNDQESMDTLRSAVSMEGGNKDVQLFDYQQRLASEDQ